MKHYLLNHQPQKGLQAACAQQGQAPTCNARGEGRTSASPKTLTRILLVLLTMFLLPSAAWGQTNYPITVAGVQVTAENSTGITGTNITGSVSYDASTSTLTLSGAVIQGSVILQSGLENLTIHLVGENKIKGESSQNELENGIKREDGTTSGTLTFTTDNTNNPGNLFFPNVTTPIEGFTDIVYNNGLEWGCNSYTDTNSIICTDFYQGVGTNVVIAAVSWKDCITRTHKTITINGGGTIILYNNSDGENFLKLSGITDFNTSIDWYSPDDVTIEIDGDNSFVFDSNSPKIIGNSQSNISFRSASTSTSATLRFWHKGTGPDKINLDVPYISGFKNAGNPNLGAGLYHVDLIDTRKDNSYYTDFTEHYITTKAYDLIVGGVRVHNIDGVFEGHKDHIRGESSDDVFDVTVKFDPDNNTLTLENATLGQSGDGHNEIVSGLSSLNVYLKGVNVINCANEDKYIFEGGGSSTSLTFSTDPDNPGTLTMSSGKTGFGTESFYTNFSDPVYNGSLQANVDNDNNVVISWAEPLGLTVAGVEVTSANYRDILDGENKGKVSFKPAGYIGQEFVPATLTLNGATITGAGGIFWGKSEELCIEISGNNSVENLADGYMSYAIWTENDANLTIKAADGADATLKLSNNVDNSQITSYTDIERFTTNFSPLKKYPNTTPVKEGSYYYSYYTTYDVYDLWIGGTQVHAIPDLSLGYKDDVRGDGSVKFTPASGGTSGTLTLENAKNNIGEIISGLSSLTIHVIGENTTQYIQADPSATAGTLTLEKEDANSLLKFDPAGVSIDSFIFGFTSFTNNDFTLFGFDSDFNPLSGGFSYTESIQSLGWSGSDRPSIMVACVFFEGDGTTDSPYLIQTKEDLAKLSTFCGQGLITHGSVYQLSTDINCNGLVFEPIGVGEESGIKGFTGIFDGNSKTISNLTINTNSAAAGLFAKLGDDQQDGIIKNLKLSNCSFIGPDDVGAVVGYFHKGTVKNCEISSCTIQCGDAQSPRVGGIAGQVLNENSISGCKVSNTTITASTTYTSESGVVSVGGIAGYVYSGCEVTECEATSVTINAHHSNGSSNAGGIAGDFGGSILKDNTVNGTQTAITTISSTDIADNFTAGAIAGNISTGVTMEHNIYYYPVTITSGKGTSDENTKSGYIHRGTNSATDPEGVVMYTKNVIIPILNDVGYVSIGEAYYYKVTSDNNNTTYSVAPSEEVLVSVEGAAIEGSYTLDNETKAITLTPKEDSSYGYTFDMPDADVTFTIQKAAWVEMFEEQTYATYYNPNEDMAVPMGMTAYIVTGISEDGTKVTVSPVSYIKAGVAVLVEKGEIGEISETTDFSGSKMAYSDPDTPAKPSATDKWYVIYNNKFVKVTTGTPVRGGKCYLNLNGTSSAGTRGFYDIDGSDGTTAIKDVKSGEVDGEKWADGGWHDLQGRRLSAKPTKPGLYILNGKKVVIK